MKIGVTGATGQLGRTVVENLKSRISQENIVALVRSPQKAAGIGVETREFDYNKPENLSNALKGIDTLLLISSNEIGQRARQHANVIIASKKAGVKWIVYTSLLHADSSSLSLAGEHLETEVALAKSGIPYTILRNGWYTENYTGSIGGALAGGAFLGSAGNGKISSAPRADYAEAAVSVLIGKGHQGKTYELAGDNAYTLYDLAAEISRQTGKNLPYKDLPEVEYANILKSLGIPEGFANSISGWDVAVSKGDLYNDSHQLSQLIGRTTISISESVSAALAKMK
jgi:NAD(P)H dehydrogenase (quinone)